MLNGITLNEVELNGRNQYSWWKLGKAITNALTVLCLGVPRRQQSIKENLVVRTNCPSCTAWEGFGLLGSTVHYLFLPTDMNKENQTFMVAIQKNPASVIEGVVCFFSVWSILGLAGFHTYLTTSNQTTNEDVSIYSTVDITIFCISGGQVAGVTGLVEASFR